MKKPGAIDIAVYALVIAVCLAVSLMMLLSPDSFMDTKAVYRGF